MCLLDQKFIKDESKSVEEYISSYGDQIAISSFKKVSLDNIIFFYKNHLMILGVFLCIKIIILVHLFYL